METGSERYRRHKVWETLPLKKNALEAARFDDAKSEQWRSDIIEWLVEAEKTKVAQQPALYLSALDELSEALNSLPIDANEFKRFTGVSAYSSSNPPGVKKLEAALRALPLPPPKGLTSSYVTLLDEEVEVRTTRLNELKESITETEVSLADRQQELERVSEEVEQLREEIKAERETISSISQSAEKTIQEEWKEAFHGWQQERKEADSARDAEALKHVATLAATMKAGEVLAEHAAGDLSATDWYGRAKRERTAAGWLRGAAMAAFLAAVIVGSYIVIEAIRNSFDLTVGDGILRSAITVVIGAFGGLLLRESSRHFREADTAEDVALSLKALAPFYANSEDEIRLAARVQVGDAVLVKNVLSRFAHRDATKHAGDINTSELPELVREATQALKLAQDDNGGPRVDPSRGS